MMRDFRALNLLILIFSAINVIAVGLFTVSFLNSPRNKTHQPTECRTLIQAHRFRARRNFLSPHRARIRPNTRLAFAFGIENAFTTPDEEYATHFVRNARNLINLQAQDWERLAKSLQSKANELISTAHRLHLASVVQSLSLRIILTTLLNAELDTLPDAEKHMVSLAQAINRAWVSSKNDVDLIEFADNPGLQASLSALFPTFDGTDPRGNPLCWILPGFETSWRINLRIVLELLLNTGQTHPDWTATMIAFAENPTKTQFEAAGADEVSAKDVVAEGLRLYPPTKRIYRAFEWEENGARHSDTFAAAVEACHLAGRVWGQDALKYNPLRWRAVTDVQKQAYLPFGGAPFECPAKAVFGPRMIALVVGVFVGVLQVGHGWRLVDKDGNGVNDVFGGERLKNDRGSYEELFLVRAAGGV
ncbi:cytochrome P450 [Aspergillus aculeatinus CBS 121060]|uniref:Cytochrome P450 n=1 Tax=Aspergillus aculeatinus CBS 121060 TaxID=1448322 RepID=A0ACD1GYV3_9EURO|nr:cytochrome P450 [Aspergillus aculeatinus CBS 121060]RAH66399.1 cytochrome P450 [Aspergillus aculeatinus CBS 121060]